MLREAGVDDFRITAMCSRKAEDAWGYVKRDAEHPQRKAVSDIPGDPLGEGDGGLGMSPTVDDTVGGKKA